MRRGPFLVLFAVSGAAALIYEVVWTRQLTLTMGHGLAAASAVLAAFMGGLAVGAGAAGRYAKDLPPARALRTYAVLELGIAILALILPALLFAVRPLLAATYADGDGGTVFAVVRLASSVLLLSVPAACMGATFPIAARAIIRSAANVARDAGGLYAANTLGAAAGAIVAGFVLIPSVGLRGTTLAGVLLNALAAAGAFALARTMGDIAPPAAIESAPPPPAAKAKGKQKSPKPAIVETTWPRLAAVALGISGFASLTLQVVWTRLLVQILGPTTYAFSTVVAIFIIGIAIGAAVASRLASRPSTAAIGLVFTLLLSAACAMGAAAAVDWALLAIGGIVTHPEYTFGDVLQREVLLVATLLLPMTIVFGAAFPFGLALAGGRDDRVTEHIGFVYAINTLGAILGSLLAGFALIPAVGLHRTIQFVAALSVVAAVAVLLRAAYERARLIGCVAAAPVVAVIVLAPTWTPSLLSSGAYKYAPAMRGAALKTALTAGELLWYREGSTGTVSVRKLTGTTSLAIDGKVDASNAGDMLTQRLLAHVPLLLHPNPQKAAILGLGSGVTLGAALTHPLTAATVLEISPEVVEASRYFETENHRALSDRRTRLIVGDGRTHLMLGRETYDVIVSEPSNPWMAGIASLFTREFFEGAKQRLAPGGVLCQWAHTYDISSSDLRSIVSTFMSVFPNGTLWLIGDADVLLVGSTEPLDARIGHIADAMTRPGVAADLASVGVKSAFAVQSLFIAQGDALAAWAAGATIQTDDRTDLEFTGPRSIFGSTRDDNAVALRTLAGTSPRPPAIAAALAAATPADWRDRGLMHVQSEAFRPAYDDLARSLSGDPGDVAALDGLIRAAAPVDRVTDAQTFLSQLGNNPANVAARLAHSKILAAEGKVEQAVRIPMEIVQANPSNMEALEQLASVLSDVGDADRLEPVVQRLVQGAPKNPWSHYYAASLFFIRSRPDLALPAARNAIALDPSNAKAHNLMGACLASMGQTDAARAAFQASLAADGREAGTYNNLATLELQAGNRDRAARYFAEALTIDPTSQIARDGLASIH